MKKIVSACVCAMLLVTVAVPVFATTGKFSFSLDPSGSSNEYSDFETKDDSEDIAYITPTGGNVASSDRVYFYVCNTSYDRISGSAGGRLKYNTKYHASYDSGENISGDDYCLEGETERYTVNVSGRWTP